MAVPPTGPRYTTTGRFRFPSRPRPALTALLILIAISVIALLAWWIF